MRKLSLYKKENIPKKISHHEKKVLNALKKQKISFQKVAELGYDYFKLPVHQDRVEGKAANEKFIKLCIENLYELFIVLKKSYGTRKNYVSTTILVTLPYFWQSQVIIFFDRSIYEKWFQRNTKHQQWKKGNKKNPLIAKFDLKQFLDLKESYFYEKIYFDDSEKFFEENDLWFYECKNIK